MNKPQSRLNFEVFIQTLNHIQVSLKVNAQNQYIDKATQLAQIIWNYKDGQNKKLRRELKIYQQLVRHYEKSLSIDSGDDKALKAAMAKAVAIKNNDPYASYFDEPPIVIKKRGILSRFMKDKSETKGA